MLPDSVRYSPELAEEICDRLAAGESLSSICEDEHMPSDTAVRKWAVNDVDGFSSRYARAREIQADTLADELLEIADDGRNDWMEREGFTVANHENIQRSKLRVDARKWLMAKMAPRTYGERTTITGANDTPLIPANTATPDRVAAVFLALAEKLPRVRAIEHSKDDETDG